MPGGNPLDWDMTELNNAIAAKRSDRKFIMDMFHFLVYWIASFNRITPNLETVSPEYFLRYKAQEESKPPPPVDTRTPEEIIKARQKDMLTLYQRMQRKKNKTT